jgi:hypothetical protein
MNEALAEKILALTSDYAVVVPDKEEGFRAGLQAAAVLVISFVIEGLVDASAWRPMETAPTDGSAVLLRIDGGEHPLEDEATSVSIGSFGVQGGAEEDPTWTFAGWSWHQDCYCRGSGAPTGWMPLPAAAAPESQP